MKVSFGHKVLNAMPTTARQVFLTAGIAVAVPMKSDSGEECFDNHERYKDVDVLVVPTDRTRGRSKSVVSCDQMFRCHVTSELRSTDDGFGPYNALKKVTATAELIPGDTVSASSLMSTYDTNAYMPSEVHDAIRKAITEAAIGTMTPPTE